LKNFWIDAARLNIQVKAKLLKISELSFREQIMITVTGVELAYYDLKLAQQNVTVQEQAFEISRGIAFGQPAARGSGRPGAAR